MYMTVLSGSVAQEDWNQLQHAFKKICQHPPLGLDEIELVQDQDNPHEWLLITLWASREKYEAAVDAKLTAPCEQMFCEAGSVPRKKHFKLVTRYQRV